MLTTSRLDLISMSPQLMAALRQGDWRGAEAAAELVLPAEWEQSDWSWLRRRPEEAAARPSLVDWLPHLVVARADGAVVGEIGFHGPPLGGEAEFGYMIVAAARRRGYATEAAEGLLAWAAEEAGLRSVRASVEPGNVASLGVLAKLGFSCQGDYLHPDRGRQLVLRRRLA